MEGAINGFYGILTNHMVGYVKDVPISPSPCVRDVVISFLIQNKRSKLPFDVLKKIMSILHRQKEFWGLTHLVLNLKNNYYEKK